MIYVCNLAEMPAHARALRPSHLVSLVAPDELPPTPPGVRREAHLRLGIDDICEPAPGAVLPGDGHLRELLAHLEAWDARAPLLVHCYAGISRSMAAALIALVLRAPGQEREAALHLRARAPHAHPNRRMIALADRMLGLAGRLVAAREEMGPCDLMTVAPLVEIALLPGEPSR